MAVPQRNADMTVQGCDFKSLRQWNGSQYRAFEELCYQLRDPTPEGAEMVKTGNPDGGLEWYVTLRGGVQCGWQAKYTFDIDMLLKLMEKSLRTVVEKRPKCQRLTFCIPFDLPDAPGTGKRKSARQKFEDRKKRWREYIPGAERVYIDLWSEGDLLQRLVGHQNQRGIEKFFWDIDVFSTDWCKQRLAISVETVGERYSPELHIDLPVAFAIEGLARSETYWQTFRARRSAVLKAAAISGCLATLESASRSSCSALPSLWPIGGAMCRAASSYRCDLTRCLYSTRRAPQWRPPMAYTNTVPRSDRNKRM